MPEEPRLPDQIGTPTETEKQINELIEQAKRLMVALQIDMETAQKLLLQKQAARGESKNHGLPGAG